MLPAGDPATVGSKSGTVAIKLDSLAAAAGLSDTDLGSQDATVTASVYDLAQPVVNNAQPIDFGIVHVGDAVAPQALSITNNAPGGGFSENLNASFGTPDAGITTNGGSISGLAAQGTDAASMTVGISTATSQIVSGDVPLTLESDGAGINSLGQTALAPQSVSVTAQVNEFADAVFSKLGGDGTFVMNSAVDYALDFGRVLQNAADPMAALSLMNDVAAPADELAGSYSVAAPDFILSGFSTFSGLLAGGSISGLNVGLDTSMLGSFSGLITLMPLSENASGFSGALPAIQVHLSGAVVPEPGCAALAALAFVVLRRRR